LYSIHAALVQNKAKHIDPISNFIIFIRYPGFVYLMSTELIWFQISTKLVGMQELFQALPRAIENGRCDDFRIGTRVSRAAFGGATRNSLARVDYSLEIAAVKESSGDREDAITRTRGTGRYLEGKTASGSLILHWT